MNNLITETDEYFKTVDPHYSIDALAGTFNRETVLGYINVLLERKQAFSMVLCDLDNFKNVNDGYGHMVGDEVLVRCAQTIMEKIGDRGVVGRYGGDEFMAVVPNVNDYDEIWHICRDVNYAINEMDIPALGGAKLTVSQGISRYPIDGEDYETLMEKTDKALYRGKQKGRNCFIIYLPEKHANIKIGESSQCLYNSIDYHVNIFRMMSHTGDLALNIRMAMSFLCNNLMLDHIVFQYNGRVCHKEIYYNNYCSDVSPISEEVLSHWGTANGLCYINNIEQAKSVGHDNLPEIMKEQHIGGMVFVRITCEKKLYGYLRADSTAGDGRIWQMPEMDLLVTLAMLIGTLMSERGTNPDEVFPPEAQ